MCPRNVTPICGLVLPRGVRVSGNHRVQKALSVNVRWHELGTRGAAIKWRELLALMFS